MMTEKQIYRRMNEAYESDYGYRDEDEWYGEDNSKIWRVYRPSIGYEIKLQMVEEYKRVDIYEKVNGDWFSVGVYCW